MNFPVWIGKLLLRIERATNCKHLGIIRVS